MDIDNLFQLLILAGAGLAWLFGGGKRKPPQRSGQQQPQQRPPRPAPRRPQVGRPRMPVPAAPRPAPPVQARTQTPAAPRDLAEEIYRILGGELAERQRQEEELSAEAESVGDRPALEQIGQVEAYSLETLEPAGEASHQRFHEKYDTEPEVAPRVKQPIRLSIRPRTVREGILWQEILGPPKSLRRDD